MADPDAIREAFDRFDTDGSGKLEKGELLNVLGELGLDVTDADFVAYAKALMEDYDADGNGELDFDEFKKLHAQCLVSEETRAAYAKELKEAVGGLVTGALTSIIENDAAAKIQAMYKGKQVRKQMLAPSDTVEAAFKKFDTDGSGKLEKGELLNVLGELGLDVTDADFVAYAKALMEDYDADGNGELDFDEFKKLHAQCLVSEETRAAYAELKEAVGGLVTGALTSIIENDAASEDPGDVQGASAQADAGALGHGGGGFQEV